MTRRRSLIILAAVLALFMVGVVHLLTVDDRRINRLKDYPILHSYPSCTAVAPEVRVHEADMFGWDGSYHEARTSGTNSNIDLRTAARFYVDELRVQGWKDITVACPDVNDDSYRIKGARRHLGFVSLATILLLPPDSSVTGFSGPGTKISVATRAPRFLEDSVAYRNGPPSVACLDAAS